MTGMLGLSPRRSNQQHSQVLMGNLKHIWNEQVNGQFGKERENAKNWVEILDWKSIMYKTKFTGGGQQKEAWRKTQKPWSQGIRNDPTCTTQRKEAKKEVSMASRACGTMPRFNLCVAGVFQEEEKVKALETQGLKSHQICQKAKTYTFRKWREFPETINPKTLRPRYFIMKLQQTKGEEKKIWAGKKWYIKKKTWIVRGEKSIKKK